MVGRWGRTRELRHNVAAESDKAGFCCVARERVQIHLLAEVTRQDVLAMGTSIAQLPCLANPKRILTHRFPGTRLGRRPLTPAPVA